MKTYSSPLRKDNGFHESDDTGVLYVLTVADAANTLMRMMDEGEICLQELTGDHFQNMLQHIANDISFDWDEEIRWRIRSWKEIKDAKAKQPEETEGIAEEPSLADLQRAAAREAMAEEHLAPFDDADQEPWDGC